MLVLKGSLCVPTYLEEAEVSRGESSQSDDHGCADESKGGALLQVGWRWWGGVSAQRPAEKTEEVGA